jgi:multidrug efflux pump subunit AcrA (membrane-fusion protein)
MTRFLRLLPLFVATACGAADQQPVEPDPTEAVAAAPAPAPAERPEFVGVVTSRRSEVIPASFTGRIVRLSITPGQRVHVGDPIAKLDDTDLKSQIAGYLAEESAARKQAGASGALASAAQHDVLTATRAYGRGAGTRNAILDAQAKRSSNGAQSSADLARGDVAKTKRDIAERQLAHAEITSPLDGVVMMIKAKNGEVAQQGAPLARVFDPKDLLIRFSVPHEYRSQIALNSRVELRIEGVERPVWATVDKLADEEAPLNFTVVEADIDDSKLAPDEVRVASVGRVRIADARGGKR